MYFTGSSFKSRELQTLKMLDVYNADCGMSVIILRTGIELYSCVRAGCLYVKSMTKCGDFLIFLKAYEENNRLRTDQLLFRSVVVSDGQGWPVTMGKFFPYLLGIEFRSRIWITNVFINVPTPDHYVLHIYHVKKACWKMTIRDSTFRSK